MRKLFLIFAAAILIGLPTVASADTVTFQAPITAPNAGSGGARQFDLDHHMAYTWGSAAWIFLVHYDSEYRTRANHDGIAGHWPGWSLLPPQAPGKKGARD